MANLTHSMKALAIASAIALVGCGGGDKPDIAFVPSDGQPHDSPVDLPSAEVLNGSNTAPPSGWTVSAFPNPTKRHYGKPALDSTGGVAVLGCDNTSLSVNCLVYVAKAGDSSLTALPPFPGRATAVNGNTVLLSDKGSVVVNSDAGAMKGALSGGAFVMVATAQTVVYGINASDDFVAKDNSASDLYISNLLTPANKTSLPKLGTQRAIDAVGINASGQVVGSLESHANTDTAAYYLATSASIMGLAGQALMYSGTSRPLGVVTALNDLGQITGYYSTTRLSFVSKPNAEGVPGGITADKGAFSACCINKKGQLAGFTSFYTQGASVDLSKVDSFVSAGLSQLILSDMNDRVQLVGVAEKGGDEAIVLFTAK